MAKILIVDDHPVNRQFLIKLLGYFGHTTTEAADGQEALKAARSMRPDLVITDIVMPRMDGTAFVKEMHRDPDLADTKVVFYTASYRVPDARELAHQVHVQHVLHKPAKPEVVLQVVNELLGTPDRQSPRPSVMLDVEALRLAALTELGLDLIKETDPSRLLAHYCQAVRFILGATAAGVLILDPDAPSGGFAALVHKSDDLPGPTDVKRASERLGELMRWQASARLTGVDIDPVVLGLPSRPKTLLAATIPFPDASRGNAWLFATDRIELAEFTREDERLAVTQATQLAVTFENARLHAESRLQNVQLEAEIQERRRSEQALRVSEERFRNAFEHTNVPMVLTDLDNRFVRVNDALARLFGYSGEEILQLSMADITHPEDVAESYARRQTLLAGDVPYFQMEKRYLHKDGRVLWGLTNVSLIRDAAGAPQQYVGQVQDITERRRAEEANTKYTERLKILHQIDRALIAGEGPAAIAAAALVPLRELLGVSRAIVNLFDLANGEVEWLAAAGRRRVHVGPGVRFSIQLMGDVEALRRGEPQLIDVHALPPGPEVDALLTSGVHAYVVVPMMAGGELIGALSFGGGAVPLSTEQLKIAQEVAAQFAIALAHARLHERVKVQARELEIRITERKRLEEQFQQAQKMEAVGRLAGGVAHDFNNLLTVIIGYAEMLQMRLPAADRNRDLAREIVNSGQRAAGLTQQLLAFSRQQVIQRRPLDLNAAVHDIEKMLRRLIGEDVRLETRLAPNMRRVLADLGQIGQVVMNLAVNARDAMPEGGELVIETGNVDLSAAYAVDHVGVQPGPHATLTVTDTGTGMSQETLAHIFEPFFTTKEIGKGTGLGLATVYGIVKQFGGHIDVSSEVGRGTTFRIYLPEAPSAAVSTESPSGILKRRGGGETILLVEDDESVRTLTAELLREGGYHVLVAPRGAGALAVAEARREPIHLLVSDVIMPAMSGPDLAQRIRALHAETAVLFMSGYTGETAALRRLLEQGAPFLQKPFTPDVLAKKVREVLDQPKGVPS